MSVKAAATNPTVLLIDDSMIDLHLLLEMLGDQAFSINVAFNGKDGLQKAELLLPDLILLDVRMPIMDGFVTCRKLKSEDRTRRIPVIFLTASTDLDTRLEGLSLGAVDYICKPFEAKEVIARVKIHLELAQSINTLKPAAEDNIATDQKAATPRSVIITSAAIEVLRRALKAPPTSSKLAEMIGTNEKALNEAFNAEFSLTISGWLREERLRTARHLLINTGSSIMGISDHLGYSSQANFSKAFRLRFGFSPSEARNNALEKAKTLDRTMRAP